MKKQHKWVRWMVMGVLPFYLFTFLPSNAQVGIWHNYLSYENIQDIQAAGNDLFVMASNGLYQYNKNDQSIYIYDKINGLSDTNISKIKWCQQGKRLVVVYGNMNIDLVETNNNITNISDIYTKAITGDKSIYGITVSGQYAYLACGFGIVKLNVKDAEISETYMFDYPVLAVALDDSNIYAQVKSNGVWKGSLSSNLIDKTNWQKTNSYPSFAEDKTDYNENYELVSTLNPGGPKYNYFGFMKIINGKLYTCNGSFTNAGVIQILENGQWTIYSTNGISEVADINHYRLSCLSVDPTSNDEHIFAGSRNGLFEFRNGQFVKYYNYTNSPIERTDGINANFEMVSGTIFDANGNLWFLNSSAPTASLIKLSTNGEFTKYNHSEYMKYNSGGFTNKSNPGLSKMIFDSHGMLWFVNETWTLPAFYQYNITDDTVRAYEAFINQDGSTIDMPSGITSIAEDLEGNMWIGTPAGPLLLEKDKLNEDNPTFTQVKVPRNDGTDYADYLLSGIRITCIGIDAAGRKWFGTNGNGVFLIGADNISQIHHFTSENSYLLSDNIQSLAINNNSGEVFFGTDNGLCSYMSDATTTSDEMSKDNVWAYPNPVTPEYTGLITIVGLTFNADVKILSASGALIAEGRSNGGTFTWDGCDKNGNRVASGVYMVATATNSGEKGTVCKIAIIN